MKNPSRYCSLPPLVKRFPFHLVERLVVLFPIIFRIRISSRLKIFLSAANWSIKWRNSYQFTANIKTWLRISLDPFPTPSPTATSPSLSAKRNFKRTNSSWLPCSSTTWKKPLSIAWKWSTSSRTLLRFIYTDQVNLTVDNSAPLMAAAERYFLDLLKWKCEDFLLQNLTIENGSELLMLADVHDAVNLKESAVEFIRKFPAEVKKTDGWKDLKKCLSNTRRKMEIIFISPFHMLPFNKKIFTCLSIQFHYL